MIELSAATFGAWRELFAGQERWVRGLVEPVADELRAIPADSIWNGFFESGDAELYYALLLALRPQRVIELGSGFSSSFAARALARSGRGRLTCIDPSPRASLPPQAEHLACPWQEVDPAVFSALAAGDVLFLDSSHTAEEALSLYLLLDVLPPGVLVHVHDILHPYPPTFPEEYLMISYFTLRRAQWEGMASLSLLHSELGPRFVELFPSSARVPWRSPGSAWLRRRSP
ncbi:MAG: class I SAM-dependent methyltransferase [Myxococcales bacterium]|nr:class I SAM-dependent methyltransferase [Myxococcales bacterium]